MNASLAEFARRTSSARRVLVVDLGFLGDSVHLVPPLWEIRRHYATAELHVVATPVACQVIGLAGCADRLWPMENMPGRRSWTQQARLVRALRAEALDVAIVLNAVDRSIILAALTGARERLGLLGGRRHFWNRWAIPNWLPAPSPELPVFEQRRQALTAAGFRLEAARFDLKVPAADVEWARQSVAEGAVHVSLNSASALKEWPVPHYAAMVHEVLASHPEATFVLSATENPREQARVDAFFARVSDPRVQRLPAGLPIARLAAALQRCRLHVGPDSGVIHLAAALGVPTLSFFRQRGAYQAWLPAGSAHCHVLAPCDCESDRDSRCAELGRPKCLAAVEPERVAGLVRQRLR